MMDDGRQAVHLTKGLCTIGVLCIHARVLQGTYAFKYLINRSVGVFIVLFGLTSEAWYRSAAASQLRSALDRARAYVWNRAKVLAVPWWCALLLWRLMGCAALSREKMRQWGRQAERSALPSLLGFASSWGTSWFVAEICLLVLSFPCLHAAGTCGSALAGIVCILKEAQRRRANIALSVHSKPCTTAELQEALGIFGTLHSWEFLNPMQNGNIARLAFGMWLAGLSNTGDGCIPKQVIAPLAVLGAAGTAVHMTLSHGPEYVDGHSPFLLELLPVLDMPLAAATLWASDQLIRKGRKLPSWAKGLVSLVMDSVAAIGKRSWGIYLGHAILHGCIWLKRRPFHHLEVILSPSQLAVAFLFSGLTFDRAVCYVLGVLRSEGVGHNIRG